MSEMEMSSKTIEIYNILKKTFSEEEAGKLIDYMDRLPLDRLATKDDLYALKEDIHRLDQKILKLDQKIDGVRSELKDDIHGLDQKIGSLRTELKEDIHSIRTDFKDEINRVIKWVAGTGFAVVGVLITLVSVFRL